MAKVRVAKVCDTSSFHHCQNTQYVIPISVSTLDPLQIALNPLQIALGHCSPLGFCLIVK